jgi:hypothetical protein
MQYDNTKHKFRTIHVQTNNNEHQLTILNQAKNNYFVTQYKTDSEYLSVDEISIVGSYATDIVIEVQNIDETNIAFLQPVLIFSTTEGYKNSATYLNYIPIYQQMLEAKGDHYIYRFHISASQLNIPISLTIRLYISNKRQF